MRVEKKAFVGDWMENHEILESTERVKGVGKSSREFSSSFPNLTEWNANEWRKSSKTLAAEEFSENRGSLFFIFGSVTYTHFKLRN